MTNTKKSRKAYASKKIGGCSCATRQRKLSRGREKTAGLTPTIPAFCETESDDDVETHTKVVSIITKLCFHYMAADKNSKTNFKTKSFDRINLFMPKGGLEVLKLKRCVIHIST